MADEFKTLLKIEGDASGAKKAAAEAKQAVADLSGPGGYAGLGTSSATASRTVRAASSEVVDAQQSMYLGISKSAATVEEAGSKARRELEALKMVAGRINPELAMMGEVALRGKEALSAMFTPIGAAAGGALLAITGIIEAVSHLKEEAEEARKSWEAMIAATQRHLAKTAAREEGVADVMAKAGKRGDEVVKTASAIEKRMVDAGFKPEAVRAVLPYAVDAEGKQVLDNETIQKLAAQQEFGGDKLSFDRPKEMTSKLRGAIRATERDPKLTQTWVDAASKDRRAREAERITYGDQSAWAAKLAREEPGLGEKEMTDALKDVEQIRTKGAIDTDGYYGSHTEDRLKWEARNREAARRAKSLGVISGEEMRKASDRTLNGEEFSWVSGAMNAVSGAAERTFGGKDAPAAAQPQNPPPAVAPPMIYNFHGPTFMNRQADRSKEYGRVQP